MIPKRNRIRNSDIKTVFLSFAIGYVTAKTGVLDNPETVESVLEVIKKMVKKG